MSDVVKRNVQIKIASGGTFTLTAGEGLTGEGCMVRTQQLELVLGGTEVDGGKTDAFYEGDESPVSIDLGDNN